MSTNTRTCSPILGDGCFSDLQLFDLKSRNVLLWIDNAEREIFHFAVPSSESELLDAFTARKTLIAQMKFINDLNIYKSSELGHLGTLKNDFVDKDNPKIQMRIRFYEYLKLRIETLLYDSELKFHRSVSIFKSGDDFLLNWLSDRGFLEIYSKIEDERMPHPVLLTDVVLWKVFTSLSLETLKQCRLVCHKWKSVSTPKFKRVAICFTNLKGGRTPDHWNIDGSFFPGIEFSAFKFRGYPLWNFKVFRNFVVGASAFLTELTLDGIAFHSGKHYEADLTSLLGNHSLKRLHLGRSLLQEGDRLCVSLDKLASVQYLKLQCCTVYLNSKSARISPTELEFAYVRFIQDGNVAAAVLVNQFVDFSHIDKLHLCDTIENSLVIDLGENISATSLTLSKTLITDWENARWSVDQLTLSYIHVEEKTLIKVKELEIRLGDVNLTVLPTTLHKLTLDETNHQRLHLLRVTPLVLPELNYLEVSSSDIQDLSYLTFFNVCEKLSEVRLLSTRKRNLDLRILPRPVRKLTVSNVRLSGDTDRNFEVVRLLNQHIGHVKYVVTNFCHTENLIVEASKDIQVYEDNRHYDEFNVLNLLENTHFRIMVLGKFVWNNYFWMSPICQFFDKEAKYYVIENFKAKAIDSAQFSKFLE